MWFNKKLKPLTETEYNSQVDGSLHGDEIAELWLQRQLKKAVEMTGIRGCKPENKWTLVRTSKLRQGYENIR